MEVHINDLSLSGQYRNIVEFRAALDPLLQFRLKYKYLAGKIFCSRTISNRPVTATESLHQIVVNTRDHVYVRLVLSWLTGSGPFWDDERFSNVNDYFHFEGIDVTDQGLGEAARRVLVGIEASSFSFLDSANTFARTPLAVGHGLEEEPLGTVAVRNFWSVDSLKTVLDTVPSNWNEMLERAATKFAGLLLAPYIIDSLSSAPFNNGIAERVADILSVLQGLASETKDDGSLTGAGMELWQKHSVGEKAWITDESIQNKRYFKTELTFKDPQNPNRKIFCPWHGKVKIGQFRIHFEWPRPEGQRLIKVVYIGPKITKH